MAKSGNPACEPRICLADKRQQAASAASRPTLLRTVEAIRTWVEQTEEDLYVPVLV